ncbi:MAG: DUF389 domain-containing protein [Deltaproteobacteria bacterium]|nr:DUF389 domain-containing protein [Deltaproteobacteria bacterium]
MSRWLPRLRREERRELSLRIAAGAVADADFVVMMGLAAALASLGLLQGSTAVVIGAMLVAPLMGPLVASGFALVQGNVVLFRMAMGVSVLGVGLGFGISVLVGLGNPGYEPSMEIEARGLPDLMDLAIGFASGMAAAYAMGRPKVASTLAGVAIAAALVPPLAVVGVALTNDRPWIAVNAGILLLTNLVAIILGAAMVFRLLRVHVHGEQDQRPAWASAAIMTLVLLAVLVSAPLFLNVLEARREGRVARPLLYPVAPHVRAAVHSYVDEWPGIEVILLGRPSVEARFGLGMVLASDDTVPAKFESELRDVIREARGDDPAIAIFALRSASARAE